LFSKQNLQRLAKSAVGSRPQRNDETNPQDCAASSTYTCLATLQKIRTEQQTEPSQATDGPGTADSCTVHVPASTASESKNKNNV